MHDHRSVAATNRELLAELDGLLLETETRLANYAELGPKVAEAADEGLVLAVRLKARLGETERIAWRARRALEHVGVGEWSEDEEER